MMVGFTPSSNNSLFYDKNGFVWITIADLKEKVVSDSTSKISLFYIEKEKPSKVPKNSLLYSFKLSVGVVAFNDREVYTNEAIISFLEDKNVNLPFLYYSSRFIAFNANENIYGAKLLNQELIQNARIIFPPLEEQKAIAEYLDMQIEKIDLTISKIKSQIKLMKEYKTTLISETTSGRVEIEK